MRIMSKSVRHTKARVGVRTCSSDDITYVANVIMETFLSSRVNKILIRNRLARGKLSWKRDAVIKFHQQALNVLGTCWRDSSTKK